MGHSCCFQNPWWNFYAGVDPHVGSFFMILIWPGGAASGGHVLPLHWLLKNQVSGIRKPMRIWHVSKESAKAADRFASCMDPSSGRWGDIFGGGAFGEGWLKEASEREGEEQAGYWERRREKGEIPEEPEKEFFWELEESSEGKLGGVLAKISRENRELEGEEKRGMTAMDPSYSLSVCSFIPFAWYCLWFVWIYVLSYVSCLVLGFLGGYLAYFPYDDLRMAQLCFSFRYATYRSFVLFLSL